MKTQPYQIPYGVKCKPETLADLPDGVYITFKLDGHNLVLRTLPVLTPNGGRNLESEGTTVWSIYAGKNISSYTPLTIGDVFAFYPLGTKVKLYAKQPGQTVPTLCDGLIVGHLKQRVKVRVLFPSGGAVERPCYPTQLRTAQNCPYYFK